MSMRSPDDSGAAQLPTSGGASDDDSCALEAESIGRYLSQQRKLRGISIIQLAELTRIPIRSLDRLESGHFDHDVDGFVRGFVRTVAEGLGLDPEDALARMLAEPMSELDSSRPVSLWLGRSLVGLGLITVLALAVGLVQAVVGGEESAPTGAVASALVWRSDPVRSLANANAATPAELAVKAEPPADSALSDQTPLPADSALSQQAAPPVDSAPSQQAAPPVDSALSQQGASPVNSTPIPASVAPAPLGE